MAFSRKTINVLVLLLLVLGVFTSAESAHAQDPEPDVVIYIFWGNGCPHCERARPVLQDFAERDPRIAYQEFEIYYEQENQTLFRQFAAAFGFEPHGVPSIFIGDRYWEGWSDGIAAEIESHLQSCLNSECPDLGAEVLAQAQPSETEPAAESSPSPTIELTPTATDEPTKQPAQTSAAETHDEPPSGNPQQRFITLPLIGEVDLSNQSLLISTLLISFIDGFNPCSLWVLSMLLAITLNSGSRKKVMIIGLVFIFVTGLIYALFIGGIFTIFSFISILGWIRIVVAVVALFFAFVNIKDYFWYKQGLSFTISDDQKPGIYKGIRRVMNAGESISGLILSTVILAAGVSLVEFSCTAGLPILWTNLLISHEVSGLAFVGFLLVYMLVYQIDELGIFLVSVFTLRKTKLEEKHGRVLKLLGGSLMLSLAVVMLVDPQLMNNLTNALLVFGAAMGLTALVLLVHRVILPRLRRNNEGE